MTAMGHALLQAKPAAPVRKVYRRIPCETCNGTGYMPDPNYPHRSITCRACPGTGWTLNIETQEAP